MNRSGDGFTCPRCGQAGSVTHGDGTPADFETGAPGKTRWGIAAAVLLAALGALGAAGWVWRAELADLLPGARPQAAAAAPEAPHWRLARREDFAEPLRAGLIGVFGTGGEDRPEAFAVLGSGELVTVLGASAGAPGTIALLRMDGSAEPGTILIDAPEGLIGASLAPGQVTGVYLALTEPAGVRLMAYEDGAAPVWTREMARSPAPQRRAEVIAAGGRVYLAGPAESAGRISVAAYAEDGAQLWQRSFEAPEEGRIFVSAADAGGLFLAFETAVTASGAEAVALWLSEGGETTRALAGLELPGRLAGARPEAGGAWLLSGGAAVTLQAVSPEGAPLWQALVPEAALHEALYLEQLAPGEISVLSAYRLSDVQTDLTVSRFGVGGAPLGAERFSLPPGVTTGALAVTRANAFILSGRIGDGAAADAFLLALELEDAAPAAAPADAPPAERPAAQARVAGQAAAPPVREEDASAGTPGAEAGLAPRVCRFTCQDEETVFPLSRTLAAAEAEDAARLAEIQDEACRMLGAEPAQQVPPTCAP